MFCLFAHVVGVAPGIYSSTEMLDFGTLRSQGIESYKAYVNMAKSYIL